MAFQLTQIVAGRVQLIGLWRTLKGGQHRLVDLFGHGAAHRVAAVE